MLFKRFIILSGLLAIFFMSNHVMAQLSCPGCGGTDVTIDLTSGYTVTPYSTAISPGSGKNICITGPASGAPALLSSTFTFSGANTVCFSGLVTMSSNISTTYGNQPTIIIQSGAVLTHTGTFDLGGSGYANKTYLTNYGTYSNTNVAQFKLTGTQLYNAGTFNSTGAVIYNSNGNVIKTVNTLSGVMVLTRKLDLTWGGTTDTLYNAGSLTAACFTSSGASGVFSNPAGSTLKITGTDAACGGLAYNNGVTSLNVNGTFDVSNGTADFSTSSPATDLSGAKMYVTNFTGASHSFVTTPTCMSIKVTGQFNFNFGITITGKIYVWDTTPTSFGNDQGDKYAGGTIACIVNGAGASGCATVNNSWNTNSNLINNYFIYSSVDGGSSYGCPTLPVLFIDFKARQTSNGNLLTWSTSEELNANAFIIERSSDGIHFEPVGKVLANGNTTLVSNYQFIDKESSSDLVYYRINEVDKNGRNMYSNIVAVDNKLDEIAILLGNPVKDDIKIQLLSDENNIVSLVDMQGQVLFEKVYSGSQQVNIKSQFAPGVYIVKVSNEAQSNFMKLIIE